VIWPIFWPTRRALAPVHRIKRSCQPKKGQRRRRKQGTGEVTRIDIAAARAGALKAQLMIEALKRAAGK
jgi:hypothetical protein